MLSLEGNSDPEFDPGVVDVDKEIKKALQKPGCREADKKLRENFVFIETMLKAKAISKRTQSEIAEKMGTKQTAISRILSERHGLNLKTFIAYLHANQVRIKSIELEKEPDLVIK